MRVCLLAPSLEAGGAERQLTLLANGLARRGHGVDVALFRRLGPLLGELGPGVRLHDLGKGGRGDVRFLWRLWRFLRRGRHDCLYTFLGVPNIAGALLRPFIRPTRLVWSVRASNMDMRQYSRAARAARFVEERLAAAPDLIVANAEAGKRCAVEHGFPAGRMAVVPNGIDTDVFFPDRGAGDVWPDPARRGDGPLVGVVGRIDPMKGHEVFLRAAAMLAEALPAIRFVCVGGGDASLLERLRRRADDLGLGERLAWAGRRDDMPAVYNALDLCCLPSLFGEGFPNVLGEAMACGVPCVATDVGDAAALIGGTGAVAPPGDPEALCAAVLETLARARDGGLADPRARIMAEYSLEAMVGRTEALLAGTARGR
ncbi:glycosyltransferase [Pseudodesulfovibrio sp.]|uniref:glycosyltransferase n=1 Tax=Pseudodesulfovibrio sp. TaxID=2035812 RepID=UPI0026272A2E|nr:glycosyltransferase [Pseudodesulfovibrio sp.]MDD3312792.1 glycosyltransferase [Pseudodesulfovibrio sp.]